MKREEKAKHSKDRILSAAMEEFGTKSYDAASLNNICNDHGISKGLIYHYFGNKDDLYLCCVKLCYEKFIDFIAEESYDFSDPQKGMNQYLERRFLFFRTYVQEGHLFFHTVLQPPQNLSKELQKIKEPFEEQCRGYYVCALKYIKLRKGITSENALEYFTLFQELFNGYFNRHADETANLDDLVLAHEDQLGSIFNMMLFGIAREKEQ